MSEFKFSCPQCGQKISGDQQYAGTQIACPACQNEIVVPQKQAIASGRLQVRKVAAVTAHAPPPPPPPPTAAPSFARPAYIPQHAASSESKTKMIVVVSAICLLVLCPIIFFFAFPDQASALENKFGFAGRKPNPDTDGGQLGHIAELYSVLDATDPDKMAEAGAKEEAKFKKKLEENRRAAEQAEKDAALAEANTPLGEITWNLNPSLENIPTGRPHGVISNTNFVADVVRLDNQANQYLLTLRQGTNLVADCELSIYLQLKPDERIEGKSWSISSSQKTGAPRIVKKWKANPKFAPLQKIYAGGYAMLLEFGQSAAGRIPATIYVALPDAEKSHLGGEFKVDAFRQRFSFKNDDDEF
jgi:DNA-directed RNA polymerase subunit RPC12/RpoP